MGGGSYVKAYQLPAVASWEIDLFGKILNTKRGQKVAYEQSKYAEQAVRSQIICGIANIYYSLLMLDRQVEITTETAAIYKENVRVMEAMKVAGMTTEAGVAQMRAASHQVEASLLQVFCLHTIIVKVKIQCHYSFSRRTSIFRHKMKISSQLHCIVRLEGCVSFQIKHQFICQN